MLNIYPCIQMHIQLQDHKNLGEITIQSSHRENQRVTTWKRLGRSPRKISFPFQRGNVPLSGELSAEEDPLASRLGLWHLMICYSCDPGFSWHPSSCKKSEKYQVLQVTVARYLLQNNYTVKKHFHWLAMGHYWPTTEPDCARSCKPALQMWLSDHVPFYCANWIGKPFWSIVIKWWCEVERKVYCSIDGSWIR